jgi:hypothetical protein
MKRFNIVSSPSDKTSNIKRELRDLFPQKMTVSDESDMRQIAKAIASGLQFFITKDKKLLNKAEQVEDRFGIRIINPSDFMIHQDTLIREAEYQPARLAGSRIQKKRVSLDQSHDLENLFQYQKGEKKSDLRRKLHQYLADPYTYEVDIISVDELASPKIAELVEINQDSY